LTGRDFVADFGGLPLADLANKIQHTMPANDPGHLSADQTVALVAYLLQVSGFPSGSTTLPSDAGALQQITWPAGAARAKAATSMAPQALSFSPVANLAQLMRGIFFPSSNIVFNTQGSDPSAPRANYEQDQKSAFSWVDWGAGIYSQWELVDYAALSIAEAAPLLLVPDRRCENGRRAPVERPDWIKFTQELMDAARASYRASQSRNQDTVGDSTNRLSDACLACHVVYRDKGMGPPSDPSKKAARCTP
jgi:hypothetical protein